MHYLLEEIHVWDAYLCCSSIAWLILFPFRLKLLHKLLKALFHFSSINHLLNAIFPLDLFRSHILFHLKYFYKCKGFSLLSPLLIQIWVHILFSNALRIVFSKLLAIWRSRNRSISYMIGEFELGLCGLPHVGCSAAFLFSFCDAMYLLLHESSVSRTLWTANLS